MYCENVILLQKRRCSSSVLGNIYGFLTSIFADFFACIVFSFFFCIMYYTKCIKHRNKIKVRRTCCFIWLSLVILNYFVGFVFQHHHDHLIHCSGARAHAAVSVDVQSRVDQHTRGEPSALRRDHSHPLQHPHSHRVRGLAKIPLYSSG